MLLFDGAADGVAVDGAAGMLGVIVGVATAEPVAVGVLVTRFEGIGDGTGVEEAGTAGVLVTSGAGRSGEGIGDGAFVWLPTNNAVPIPKS
jgi:hypothetical protein